MLALTEAQPVFEEEGAGDADTRAERDGDPERSGEREEEGQPLARTLAETLSVMPALRLGCTPLGEALNRALPPVPSVVLEAAPEALAVKGAVTAALSVGTAEEATGVRVPVKSMDADTLRVPPPPPPPLLAVAATQLVGVGVADSVADALR